MSLLFFPTRPDKQGSGPIGLPMMADPCQCVEGSLAVAHSDTCLRCGRLDADTISETWRQRAIQIAA